MTTQHAKSPCCRGRINRFGKRRRQCGICKHTWSIRKKRRGRKRKRIAAALLSRILIERHTIIQEQRRSRLSKSGIASRYLKAMRAVAARHPLKRLPTGPYALLGDGLYFKFKRREWVMYLMAIKPARSHKAYFLDPVLLEGRECYERWVKTIATIPPNVKNRVQAFVSDGFRGAQLLSEQNRWLHQRCHFHLLAALVRGKGKRRYRIRSSNLRDKILEATRLILGYRNERVLKQARKIIRALINRPVCPPYIRKQALEFLEREQDFQTYLHYPSLHLPTTTNAVESTGRMVRRAIAFLRLKRYVICNGNINRIN